MSGVDQPDGLARATPISVSGAAAPLRTASGPPTLWRLTEANYGGGHEPVVRQAFNGLAAGGAIHASQVRLIPEPVLPGDAPADRRSYRHSAAELSKVPRRGRAGFHRRLDGRPDQRPGLAQHMG